MEINKKNSLPPIIRDWIWATIAKFLQITRCSSLIRFDVAHKKTDFFTEMDTSRS